MSRLAWIFALLIFTSKAFSQISHSAPPDATQRDAIPDLLTAAPFHRLHQTLKGAGLTKAIVLSATDQSRTFYLPVPRNVPLSEMELAFHGRYLSGDPGGGKLQILVEGEPLFVRAYPDGGGVIDLTLPLRNFTSYRGVIELEVRWLSNRTLRTCEVEPPNTTSLVIEPTTTVNFNVPADAVFDLASTWQMLPAETVLTISSNALEQSVMDAAWRVGSAIELAGRRVKVATFPESGSEVSVPSFLLPHALYDHPLAQSLHKGRRSVLLDDATLGALLLMAPKSVLGDVTIPDDTLLTKVARALNAFKATLRSSEQHDWYADAIAKFALTEDAVALHNTQVLGTGADSIITVSANAAANISTLFDPQWRPILSSPAVDVETANAQPLSEAGKARLTALGAATSTLDVVNHATWQMDFLFRSVDFSGRVPNELVLDVAASPDTSGARPVLSVSWNDVLLTATQLQADGEPERISTRIPFYAIGSANRLKVMLQRLPSANSCTEPQIGFPFAVLPTSYIGTKPTDPHPTFIGLMPYLAHEATLVIPSDWLDSAGVHLTQMINLARISGLSPADARLVINQPDESFKPTGPFVAMDVPVHQHPSRVSVDGSGQLTINGREQTQLNIRGLSDVATVEVVQSENHLGLSWNAVASFQLQSTAADSMELYALDRGDIAVISANRLVGWFDSTEPSNAGMAEKVQSAFYEWRRWFSWGVPTIIGLIFLIVVLLALSYRAGRLNGRK